ncbi:hypothetical protein MKX03_005693 [Papaver bracteatum]|nr:hypothetical protein MKX03_005693 [Papaver bracteatum]
MPRWDELNNFFEKAGASIIFRLNAVNGGNITRYHFAVGPWDFKNAAALIHYPVGKNCDFYDWELGPWDFKNAAALIHYPVGKNCDFYDWELGK